MSARLALREATGDRHDKVDAAYGDFDLKDAESYRLFLAAHARALPPIELAVSAVQELPAFRPRTHLLREDLARFGTAMPDPLPFAASLTQAAAFGALYVIEGSRLGGALLARAIPPALPRAYLSAAHQAGEWRTFGERLDQAARLGGRDWLPSAIDSAKAAFALYEEAARIGRRG